MKLVANISLISKAIDMDARDPTFAASLRSIGPVIPMPTLSNSSTFNNQQSPHPARQTDTVFPQAGANPALLVWTARQRAARAAEMEAESFAKPSYAAVAGREYLDALTIRQTLVMREQGLADADIERMLRLKKGLLRRLGGVGVVSAVL